MKERVRCNKKLERFWVLLPALKYLLDEATRSEELITLANMWPYRYTLPVSLFPRDTKPGKAVERYLSRFDGKEQCESEPSAVYV